VPHSIEFVLIAVHGYKAACQLSQFTVVPSTILIKTTKQDLFREANVWVGAVRRALAFAWCCRPESQGRKSE
jgi:hypothetical protein